LFRFAPSDRAVAVAIEEHALMSTGFIALSNHGTVFQPARFFVADEMTLQPAALTRASSAGGGRPK
jgi:hypothetical protein